MITLGLSEVWYQKRGEGPSSGKEDDEEESDDDSDDDLESEDEEGEDFFAERDVLWRAVPSDRYDPERHGFRATTVSENLTNLKKIVKLIRTHVPKASIVFTLSPVPLAATFRGVSCVTANATSKAVLRVAVDELMRENGLGGHRPRAEKRWKEQRAAQLAAVDAGRKDLADAGKPPNALFESASKLKEKPGLYYWPAYEMVKEGFRDPYMDDGRHPRPEVVKEILELFGKYYLPAEGEEVEEEEEVAVEGGDKVDDDEEEEEEEEDGKTDPDTDYEGSVDLNDPLTRTRRRRRLPEEASQRWRRRRLLRLRLLLGSPQMSRRRGLMSRLLLSRIIVATIRTRMRTRRTSSRHSCPELSWRRGRRWRGRPNKCRQGRGRSALAPHTCLRAATRMAPRGRSLPIRAPTRSPSPPPRPPPHRRRRFHRAYRCRLLSRGRPPSPSTL